MDVMASGLAVVVSCAAKRDVLARGDLVLLRSSVSTSVESQSREAPWAHEQE